MNRMRKQLLFCFSHPVVLCLMAYLFSGDLRTILAILGGFTVGAGIIFLLARKANTNVNIVGAVLSANIILLVDVSMLFNGKWHFDYVDTIFSSLMIGMFVAPETLAIIK